ncbi:MULTISPECIES: NAD(P)/FAD-dependent oxidoreductase [Vibrio]|uniref:NAD(P)/FAD-dependent oxidoreductase n=1 Tax=Vibrio TaxID=662 RepID=UPI0001B954AC|nr:MULTISPECIES: NAD(P)/FAD-dependent oxidoreductase [Vibrio]EEX31563.1 amine oxidase flavin-containing [Vibrio coralliilyticus ATCC BAA-450]MCM5506772.1 NAD(P)/FAD-dependent oxidoreductase [Vibrio sp. SCSIO 43169]MDE3898751.1 NAD(P)/FAD-dependent oxidoreductase [Vibrio sp. CC007]QFT36896.1 protoporphyrinogen oxidase [Vibrio sp. THAF64]QGM34797.1 protoporphyrinogen oxidase [Vibrio sp. THAF191d]
MKIAIIGTGISGLTCAYHLNKQHDVTLFEANDYIGGHTATVNVEVEGESYAVDTGFIVYNDRTYPHFMAMMEEIGVEGIPTQMSFSVRNDDCGLEYNGHTLSTLFAQKRNWFNPRFYAFIFEILRFNKQVKRLVEQSQESEKTLGDFLSEEKFSDYFCDNYILPMGAAIWSSTLADMRAFPLQFFARFFLNHGLLDVLNRPQWYVVKGGSNAYVEPLTRDFADNIKLSTPVKSVRREQLGVRIELDDRTERFDQVIFACHSDQALALLSDANCIESEVLGQLEYQANEVTLHTDESLLPKRKSAWASWNYWLDGAQGESERPPTLTYNMNILQHIQAPVTFCVSLNSAHLIEPNKVLKTFTYHHPVFSEQSMQAQRRRQEINGQDKVWFCGAYWYNGFHEDGVKSALDVVRELKQLNKVERQRGAA